MGDDKLNMNFWHTVLAVVLGLFVFQWLQAHQAELSSFPWWVLIVIYIVGGVAIQQWRDWRWEKNYDKKQLEFAKSKGFESHAEYMAENATWDVRDSWIKVAEEEKKKRKK